MVNDSMGASNFCGLIVEDDVPDHSVLSRFRTAMTKAGIFDRLLNEINRQLETRGIMIKKAVKVDASITRSPRKPRGIVDRTDSDECAQSDNKSLEQEPEKFADRVDTNMRWTKKNGEFHFGAKKHCLADDNGLMVAIETTPDAWRAGSERRPARTHGEQARSADQPLAPATVAWRAGRSAIINAIRSALSAFPHRSAR